MIRKIATATSLQVFSFAISLADRILLGGFLLRFWGVAIFEDWSILFAAAGLINLLDFGLHMTFSNRYTIAYQQNQLVLFQRHVATSLFINAVILAMGLVLLTTSVSINDLSRIVAATHLDEAGVKLVFVFFSTAILLQTAACAVTTLYRAQGRFSRGLCIDVVLNLTRISGVASAALFGGGPAMAAAAYLAVTAVFILVIVPYDLRANLDEVKLTPAIPTRFEIANILKVAPWFYAQHATGVLLLSVPLLILPHVTEGVGSIAMFQVLRTMINMVRQVVTSLSNSMGVELSQLYSMASDVGLIQKHLWRSTRLNIVIGGAGAGAVFWLTEPFIILWSNNTLRMDVALAVIFGAGFLISTPFTIISNYLNYIGEVRIGTFARIANLSVAVGVGIIFAQTFGVLGVAVGLAVGEAIGMGVLYLTVAAKWTGIPVVRLAALMFFFTGASLAPIMLIGLTLHGFGEISPVHNLIIRAAFLMPAGLAIIYLLGLSKRDRAVFLTKAFTKVGFNS